LAQGARYGLEVRAASEADAEGLADLLATAGLDVRTADLAERIAAVRRQGGTVLLAADWGPPAGVVAAHWFRTLHQPHATAEISLLLVRPEDRGRGVARLLLKAASQAARSAGCDTLRLPVSSDAPELLAFAQTTGFARVGELLTRPLRKRAK
jgi:aminoglycoside 6'-N-acetyltransferase I